MGRLTAIEPRDADTLNNLGLVYADKGEWDRAIEMYERSLEISERVGDVHGMAVTWNNLGEAYRALGQVDKARDCWERALAVFERLGASKAEDVRGWLAELEG